MRYTVLLTNAAARDIEGIFDYIAHHDSPLNADRTLEKIETALAGLANFPERGARPKELLALGIREYHEVFFKPYRIIYRVLGDSVFVMLIADGRRDMQALLQQRLIEGD